jgi:quercetin dioxygenase-like cupin family protein
MNNRSKVIKCGHYRWHGIPLRQYKSAGHGLFKGVTRQTLIGEGAGEETIAFVTRYFEVEPGGHTTLERHQHPHTVVVLRGKGLVTLGNHTYELEAFDCVYVAPEAVHQFRAGPLEPLGFLCVVDRLRDRPRPVRSAPASPAQRD